MKRFMHALCMFLLLAIPITAMPAIAQDGTQDEQNALNYCAAELSYDLPTGWVVGASWRTSSELSTTIGSSSTALLKDPFYLYPNEAVIQIRVVDQASIIYTLNLDSDIDNVGILRAIVPHFSQGYEVGDISMLAVHGKSGVQVDLSSDINFRYLILVRLNDETSALILLTSMVTNADQWKSVVLDVANSLEFTVPHFPGMVTSLPLTRIYRPFDDCSVVFAFPDTWLIGRDTSVEVPSTPNLSLTISSFSCQCDQLSDVLDSGQVHIDLSVGSVAQESGVDFSPMHYVDFLQRQPDVHILKVAETSISNHPAAIVKIDLETETFHGEEYVFVIQYSDHVGAVLILASAPGELDQWRDTALAIAQSLQIDLSSFE